MPKRSRKARQGDVNQTAADVVRIATEEDAPPEKPTSAKNPAAVALGRLGGKKGGKVRAERLTAARRKEIAAKAARARWARRREQPPQPE